jgi:hypothetical protein
MSEEMFNAGLDVPYVPDVLPIEDTASLIDVLVPTRVDVLPDGEPTLLIGDVDGLADFNHQQGDNPYGFTQDCGLVSVQDVLNQFGIPVTEADIVEHAANNGQCHIADSAADSGGTTLDNQVEILGDYGIPAHTEFAVSLEDLAENVENGRSTIIAANAGWLWNDANYLESGEANHAVVVTGVSRDLETGEIQGFYINDSGTGNSGQFIEADRMTPGWLDVGGATVVTDVVREPQPQPLIQSSAGL